MQQYNEVKLSEANGLATWRVWAKDPKDYANPATGVVGKILYFVANFFDNKTQQWKNIQSI